MGVSIKLETMSYEDRISELHKEIEKLTELKQLELYFKPLRNVVNIYVTEMRRVVSKKLHKKGLSYSEIGRMLGITYSNVSRNIQAKSQPYVVKTVKASYKTWMLDNVYPMTYNGRDYDESSIHKNNYVRRFTLQKINKYANQNPSAIYSNECYSIQ
jgi:predicted transcriptional regulator